MKNLWIFISLLFLTVLAFLMFSKSLIGPYSIQGTDFNLPTAKMHHQFYQESHSVWDDHYWLGKEYFTAVPNLSYVIFKYFPFENSITYISFFSITLAMIFMFLLLRLFGLGITASVFGAVTYGLTPHYLTVIHAGHIGVIASIVYPPAVLYFLSLGFRKKQNWLKNTAFLFMAGIFWALLMVEASQRGLYFSIAFAAYMLFLFFRQNTFDFRKPLSILKDKSVLEDAVKALLTALILFLVFYQNLSMQLGSENISGNQAGKSQKQTPAETWNFSTSWSMNPLELIDSVAFSVFGKMSGDTSSPYWGTKEYAGNSESLGYFTIVLTVLSAVFLFKKEKNVRFFLIIGGTALLLSFGRHFPGQPFFWLWLKLPLMDKFRAPSKFIAVTALCFSIVSAYGFHTLTGWAGRQFEDSEKKLKKFIIGLSAFLAAGVFLLIISYLFPSLFRTAVAGKLKDPAMVQNALKQISNAFLRMNILTLISLSSLAAASVLLKKKSQKGVLIISSIFIALTVYDLWTIDSYYMKKAFINPGQFFKADPVIQYFQNQQNLKGPFRVTTEMKIPNQSRISPYQTTGLRGYYLTYMFNYFDIQPFDVVAFSRISDEYNNYFLSMLSASGVQQLQNWNDLLKMNRRLLQSANVEYVVMDGYVEEDGFLLEEIRKGYDGGDHYIYKVENALPRMGFYENYLTVSEDEAALNYLTDPTIDINNIAVIEAQNVPEQLISYKKAVPLNVRYDPEKPWVISADIQTSQPGLAVHVMKYHPNWKAYLDGKPAEIIKANYLMQGVLIPEGSHTLEFRYEADAFWFTVSTVTELTGLVLLLAVGILELFRKKSKSSES